MSVLIIRVNYMKSSEQMFTLARIDIDMICSIINTVPTRREFYERTYHYEEDITAPDTKRIDRFFKGIDIVKTHKFLDIGCGAGAVLNYCARQGLQCFGFDISARAIKLGRVSARANIYTLVADGELLPYRSASFDLVSSLGSIEHFTSVEQGLEETSRVTRKGGQVLLVVPNSFWILNKMQLYKGTEQPQEMLATIGEWARLCTRHNLVVDAVGKDFGPKIFKNRHPLGIIKRTLLKITVGLPISFAYQFILVCRKK
jgi:SAM-dependent methyltransferase